PASIGVKSVGTAVAGRPRGTSDARRTSAPPAEPVRRPAAGLVRVLVRVVVDLLGDVAVDVDVAVAQEVVEPEAAEEVDGPAALVLVLAAADVGDYAVDVFDLVLGVFLGLGRARQPNACDRGGRGEYRELLQHRNSRSICLISGSAGRHF